jgi:threonine synthase
MMQITDYTNTYEDTRGTVSDQPFSQVILEGIAPGGGLFVPKIIPVMQNSMFSELASLPYPKLAAWVYRAFGVDFSHAELERLMGEAYGSNFAHPQIAPLRTVAPDTHVLELWHGPTSAFKDMALQCLPLFFSEAISKRRAQTGGEDYHKDYLILVATSGDTGKAALEGYANREHTGIIVFYPHGGVSDIQQLQMTTQQGNNVGVFALRGNFDDCQTTVKQIFANQEFNARLANEYNIKLSSANSINWGRLLPQVVYYVFTYLQLLAGQKITAGDPIDICVPTGNFGNILAAWYARAMGVPIERLLCASNDNRVLCDFINTGTYDISGRDFVLTPSPSMDILVSSNLERQLYELCGRNAQSIRAWMTELRENQRFTVDKQTFAAVREVFLADWASANESLETIAAVYRKFNYLLDPHTAVAWKVAERLRGTNPVVVVSTAHWAKFAADVYRGLQKIPAGDPLPASAAGMGGLGLAEQIAAQYPAAAPLPKPLAALRESNVRFNTVVDNTVASAQAAICDWLDSV